MAELVDQGHSVRGNDLPVCGDSVLGSHSSFTTGKLTSVVLTWRDLLFKMLTL